MKHAAGSSLPFMLGKNYKLLLQRNRKMSKISNKKSPLDLVFNTVFINPDIYCKGTRLDDLERSKSERF